MRTKILAQEVIYEKIYTHFITLKNRRSCRALPQLALWLIPAFCGGDASLPWSATAARRPTLCHHARLPRPAEIKKACTAAECRGGQHRTYKRLREDWFRNARLLVVSALFFPAAGVSRGTLCCPDDWFQTAVVRALGVAAGACCHPGCARGDTQARPGALAGLRLGGRDRHLSGFDRRCGGIFLSRCMCDGWPPLASPREVARRPLSHAWNSLAGLAGFLALAAARTGYHCVGSGRGGAAGSVPKSAAGACTKWIRRLLAVVLASAGTSRIDM